MLRENPLSNTNRGEKSSRQSKKDLQTRTWSKKVEKATKKEDFNVFVILSTVFSITFCPEYKHSSSLSLIDRDFSYIVVDLTVTLKRNSFTNFCSENKNNSFNVNKRIVYTMRTCVTCLNLSQKLVMRRYQTRQATSPRKLLNNQ